MTLVLSNFNTYILCLLIVLTMMVISADTYSLNQMKTQDNIVVFNGLVIILLFISIIVSTAYDYNQNTSYMGKENKDKENKEYTATLYKHINNQTNTDKTAYKEVQFELETMNESLKSYNVTSLNNLLSNIDYLSTYYDTHSIEDDTHSIEDNKYDFINKTLNTFYKTTDVNTESILPELIPNLKN